ncbi:MAG: universal stress protein [Actinoplanes sp.]
MKPRVIVGVDGSAGSTAAVRWAAAEARRRDADLRVVTAYHQQSAADEERAAILHDAVTQARSIAPELDVRCLARPGYAVPVLVQASVEALLLVVGTRGSAGLPGRPAGSVSSQVALHARPPVVVVRGRIIALEGSVVVGVDDGPGAAAVLAQAFEVAALHVAPLLAVTAGRAPKEGDDNLLAPWLRKYPKVTAERRVVDGHPDRVLVELSRQARLVVVGSRGHGFEGKLLGAVGDRLLQRADCPVLIARR